MLVGCKAGWGITYFLQLLNNNGQFANARQSTQHFRCVYLVRLTEIGCEWGLLYADCPALYDRTLCVGCLRLTAARRCKLNNRRKKVARLVYQLLYCTTIRGGETSTSSMFSKHR